MSMKYSALSFSLNANGSFSAQSGDIETFIISLSIKYLSYVFGTVISVFLFHSNKNSSF